jgi:hypothetical protein
VSPCELPRARGATRGARNYRWICARPHRRLPSRAGWRAGLGA